ncbi:hypothetical protein A1OE_884 [Candidatus Endolissoclinum faulkneri L2]|uniref:Uncharacterized protein n=1 Tax=Candidatus Endolissoclinum faulkneri L2 TaxID=1193729 RepID=K7Z4W1_9PROT|nr:hypothetical protein A1OE_884 [Candidatus Endolissoclinum faulkneri L2]
MSKFKRIENFILLNPPSTVANFELAKLLFVSSQYIYLLTRILR